MARGGKRQGAGRKAKPTELKVLEGTFRKDRHGGRPMVAGGFPEAPACLIEAERALWDTFPKPAWIGQTDVVAVHAAVSTYERILRNQRAQQATDDAGYPLTIKYTVDGDGNRTAEPKESPLISQEIKLWGRLMSILGTLGLTPVDRAKVQAPKAGAVEDKWAGIL
jgi:terminase small subunit-like protein